jgi:hypothetical protein
MTAEASFQPGDRVRHADRPDWGPGVVESSKPLVQDGTAGWQLVIRFEQKGRVTVQTRYARIVPESRKSVDFTPPKGAQGVTIGTGGFAAALGAGIAEASVLIELPSEVNDLFAPVERRLAATLELFKYSAEARSLLEWASAQSGLTDPLSRFSRHELESAFAAYAKKRETHLRDLIGQIRKAGRLDLFEKLPATTPAAGRVALSKLMFDRR